MSQGTTPVGEQQVQVDAADAAVSVDIGARLGAAPGAEKSQQVDHVYDTVAVDLTQQPHPAGGSEDRLDQIVIDLINHTVAADVGLGPALSEAKDVENVHDAVPVHVSANGVAGGIRRAGRGRLSRWRGGRGCAGQWDERKSQSQQVKTSAVHE